MAEDRGFLVGVSDVTDYPLSAIHPHGTYSEILVTSVTSDTFSGPYLIFWDAIKLYYSLKLP